MKLYIASRKTLLWGVAPRVEERNRCPIRPPTIWKYPFWTPSDFKNILQLKRHGTNIPCRRASAACSGLRPSSDSSILRVILGLVLFSSMYPGLYMVPGKNIWTPMEYNWSSERRVSARPREQLVREVLSNRDWYFSTSQCMLCWRIRRVADQRHIA